MTAYRHLILRAACATVIVAAAVLPVHSPPAAALGSPASTVSTTTATSLPSAKKRAVELHERIDATEQELEVLKQRLEIADSQLFHQRMAAQDAQERAEEANRAYQERLVYLYKSDLLEPVSLIVGATSLTDLYRRAMMLSRMAILDRDTLVRARAARTEAAYEQQVLEEMQGAMRSMRELQDEQLEALKASHEEQKRIVARLTAAEKASLQRTRAASVIGRNQWREKSVSVNAVIGMVSATVEPHPHTYLVPAHQPTRYRSKGGSFTAHCSWYGNQFHGRTTASGQIFNQNDLTAASRTLPFGTRLALTRGNRRIVVVVNDRGPFIPGRDLDLSRGAARALGFDGLAQVHAEVVEPIR